MLKKFLCVRSIKVNIRGGWLLTKWSGVRIDPVAPYFTMSVTGATKESNMLATINMSARNTKICLRVIQPPKRIYIVFIIIYFNFCLCIFIDHLSPFKSSSYLYSISLVSSGQSISSVSLN